MPYKKVQFVVLALLALIAVKEAPAQSAPAQGSGQDVLTTVERSPTQQQLADRFVIDLGAFVVGTNLKATLNGTVKVNDGVDFDQVFGTDADATRVRGDVLWRITPGQHLRFMYFDNNVSRTRTIDKDIVWGDDTYKAGGAVTAQTRFKIYELDYEWAFLRRPDYELALAAGVHVDDFKAGLAGNATVTLPDGTTTPTATFQSNTASVTAPLPVIGLRGSWAATDHLMLEAGGQLFLFKYEGINGHWSDLRAGVTWLFNHHFGIGAGYDRFAVNVKLDKNSFDGRLTVGYSGLVIYARGAF